MWGRVCVSWSASAAGLISICLSLFCSAAAVAGTAGDAALYRFAPLPAWVKPASVDYEASFPKDGASGGSWILLYDRQYSARDDGHDFYLHSAARITTPGGVDEQSQINLDVDPTYQRLDLHSIKVIREGHVSDQRRTARITALPQETELRERIYNGNYNINVLLSDVRVGDIVEYDFTLHSQERIFPGQFSGHLSIGWSVPVHTQRVRVLSPVSRQLFYRVSDEQQIPPSIVHGAVRELEWLWHDLPEVAGDEDRPKWYSAWPHLQISSSKDWAEVATRVTPLFVFKEPPSRELLAVVDDIRNAGSSPAEQALHALQFVQEEIRYVSISIGPGAFRPTNPNTVLSRRFGDCKDKSLLLVTILRQLGIEAHAALVNTRRGRVLDSALPDPYSFDHAIVRVKIGEQTFWVDGTAAKRLSPLSVDSPASYGWALVVDGSTTGLENIPRPAPDAAGKKSEVLIDMSAGMGKPAKMQITTSYLGRWADSQREELADGSPQKRQSSYVNYIAGYYSGARTAAPLAINDDKVNNVVKVSEYYELPQTFKLKNGRQRFFVQVDELYRYAGNLKSSVRSSPLAIAYPADVEQRIRVILPQKWPVKDETVNIDNPAFRYSSTVNYVDKGSSAELILDYKYRSLTDYVDLKALGRYQEDRKRVDDDLGYSIGPAKPSAASTEVVVFKKMVLAPVPMWWMLFALALATYLAVRYGYRWDPEPRAAPPGRRAGIRGWLLIYAFIAAIGPIAWAALLRAWAAPFDVETWSKSSPGVHSGLLLIGGAGVMVLVGLVLTAVLFFTRRSSAPVMFVVTQWVSVGWSLANGTYLSAVHIAPQISFGHRLWDGHWDFVALAVYTVYFALSRQVRATFVKRFPGDRSPKPAPLTDAVAPSSG